VSRSEQTPPAGDVEAGAPADDSTQQLAITEMIMARISERSSTAIVPGADQTEEITIARDYLRQHQDKSVAQLVSIPVSFG
jgi:hypothetical protein